MLLKTLSAPPPMGSLRESLLLMALMMTEHIEHAKFRALAQLELDQEEGLKAFEEYMKVAFPYLETQKRRDRQQYIDILNEEIKKGLISVRPVAPPTMRSRLKERYERREKPLSRDEERRLYDKLGRLIQ